MKTKLQTAVLGTATLFAGLVLHGCAQDPNSDAMKLPDGSTAKGKVAPGAPTSSLGAYEQSKKNSQANDAAYRKAANSR